MVSIYIALYLFLAGTGAGAFLIGAVVDMVLALSSSCMREDGLSV